MVARVAINGFGRIGRLSLRAFIEQNISEFEITAINALGGAEANAHLFQYDSVHGTFPGEVRLEGETLIVNGKRIQLLQQRDPGHLPWGALGIDVVLECTGAFTSYKLSHKHIQSGAKKVLISAPATDVPLTIVYGVNHQDIKPEHDIVSNASCTTNCLAPVIDVLHREIGIEHGYMTTIHAYTGDQPVLDTMHKDLRRARAAALSLIPTSTGAAKAVSLVLPELKGKLDGTAIRVPTANVSLIDFVFRSNRKTSVEEVNNLMVAASIGPLKGVLGINTAPLVSSDFNHNPHSSVFDTTQTQIIEERLVRVLSWYDNEWGFSNRMLDTTKCLINAK